MDYVEIHGLGNKLDYYEVDCELVHYGSDLLDYVETFVQGILEVLKDTGVKGMSYDTRNAKVEAPKGYSKDVLSEGKDGDDNIVYAHGTNEL